MAGYIVKAIEENSQKAFEPEDEQDIETVISCMNDRIRKFIFFKDRSVQEEIMNEVEGTQQMIKSITADILRVMEKRKFKNLRPLEEADFEEEWGKSSLRQILQDM
ncbi:hypothetical protein D3C74_102670 [compost metagenome]